MSLCVDLWRSATIDIQASLYQSPSQHYSSKTSKKLKFSKSSGRLWKVQRDSSNTEFCNWHQVLPIPRREKREDDFEMIRIQVYGLPVVYLHVIVRVMTLAFPRVYSPLFPSCSGDVWWAFKICPTSRSWESYDLSSSNKPHI